MKSWVIVFLRLKSSQLVCPNKVTHRHLHNNASTKNSCTINESYKLMEISGLSLLHQLNLFMTRANTLKTNDLTKSAFSDATASSFSFTANSLDSCATDSLASMSLAKPVFILLANSPISSRFSLYIVLYPFMKERYDFGVTCVARRYLQKRNKRKYLWEKKTKNKNKTRKKQENNKGLVINIKEVIVE